MSITVSKNGSKATVKISDKFVAPLQSRQTFVSDLKGASLIDVELDAHFADATAAIQAANILGRLGANSFTIKSARGTAVVLPTAAAVVTVAKGCVIEFTDLPKDADNAARKAILAKLAACFGETEAVIASWFAQGKKLGEAGANDLFAKVNAMNGGETMLGRDGQLDPAKVFARWNATPRAKSNA